jgi:uncharacterized protein YjiK
MAIQITEYSYSSGNGEFVEFTNTGNTSVDMTGWSFDDNSRLAGSFSLSGFGIVKPGESVIITETVDATAFRTAWGLPATVKVLGGSNVAKVVGGSDQALQRADEINLYDNNNVLVDRLTYDDATIVGSPRTQNVSAYTDAANLGKNDATKWKLSNAGDIQGGKTAVPTIATPPITDIGSPGSTLAGIDLSRYTRVGRYDLPEPTRSTAPTGSVLAQEASGVTYDWDTDTLFIVGDGGTSVVQVDKTGKLIDSMTLAKGASPQGTEFFDPEGIAYIGNGKFVMTEERDRQIVQFTYAKDTTLTRTTPGVSTVKLGTTVGNIGLEGITYDPQTNGYVIVKEISPEGIFQTTIDFTAKTASNGTSTTVDSTNLFDPVKMSLLDLADVYALSNVNALNGKADSSHLLVLSQESGKIVNVDRSGVISSSLMISADPRNTANPLDTLTVANQSHEGITVDKNGIIYVVSENGGGDINHPELWVYAPTQASVPLVNQAPTAVLLNNSINSIADKTSTVARFKVGDIAIVDDGLGTNNLTLAGTDASSFEIFENALYIKAGTTIDFKTKSSYNVSVNVDDTTVGTTTPDAFKAFTLNIADPNPATNAGGIYITEVAPWSSGNSPVAADWFELTNTSKAAVNIAGWKFDDNSNSFASSVTLDGITSIGSGESVVFVDVLTATTAIDTFKSNWFGTNVPTGFRIGTYAGVGAGLSTGGDAVNIYNAAGDLQANVVFGGSPLATPFATFDNSALQNNATISTLSAVGVKGGFSIIDSLTTTEIGSPGSIATKVAPAVNKAPTAVLLTNPVNIIAENTSTTTRIKVADIAVTDDGLGTNNLTVNGTDASFFEIASNALYIKAGTTLDFETKASYSIAVNVDDTTVGGTPDATINFGLAVTNVNEAPTAVVLSNPVTSIAENTSTTTRIKVADIAITDDAPGTNNLTVSGTDASFFEIASNALYIKAGTTLDFETKASYSIAVNVDDLTVGATPDATKAFTLALTNVNEAPTAVVLTNSVTSIAENTATTTRIKVADIAVTDDALGTNNLTVSGTDASFFEIASNALYIKAGTTLDFETKASYSVAVNVDDPTVGATPDATVNFALALTNVNEAPTAVLLSNPVNSIAENTSTTTRIKVADIAVTDDALGTNNLTVSGTDASFFEIASNALYIKAGTTLDFETKASYSVAVNVDDPTVGATPDATKAFTLALTNVNEAPTAVVLTNPVNSIAENTSTTTRIKVADIAVTDDALGTNNLTVSGTDSSFFEIASNALYIKAGTTLDFETKASYSVAVNVDDPTVGATPDATVNFALALTNVNEAPTAVVLTNLVSTLAENASTTARVKVADIAVTDDALGTNTLTVGGTDASSFEVVGNALYIKAGTTLNYKTKNSYSVAVNVDDTTVGTTPDATKAFTLALTEVVIPPTVISGTTGDDTNIIPTSLQTIFTDGGNDLVDASVAKGDNRIYGGDGSDELYAGLRDRLFGEAGDDILDATAGKGGNRLYGGGGNDTLFAGSNDFLFGGDGDDKLFGGKGGNTLLGGAGADKFYLTSGGLPTTVNTIGDFEVGVDKLLILGVSGVTGFSNVTLTQQVADTLVKAGGKDLALLTGIQSSTVNSSSFAFS